MSDFYDCFMKCAALDRMEEMETGTSKAGPNVQRSRESKKAKPIQELIQESNGEKLSARTGVTASNAARILRSASRPDVKYFQTLHALHLQVTMVDEKVSYRTRVIKSSTIFFKAIPTVGSGLGSPTCNSNSGGYEFFVNTHMIFKCIQHSMKGRTVYIELQKKNPGYYPTQFVHLKYFQTNYDKIVIEEKWHQRERFNFEQLIRQHGWGVPKIKEKVESSEEPASETESEEGVERPEDYRKIEMN
ncbi:uncharacterized protein LOC111072797 [Drosophila obscura]|uniref:uncharacterized protein LOC111072797 n=1 Tax=Drosophila obscura TaxID=7282 RepID=UPI001BB1970E|nr:uncharacterized protein LOC111072797 [Drosophila obscura]